MTKPFAFLLVVMCLPATAALSESMGGPGGTWSNSWPKELEPLRKQAWTWDGGRMMVRSYHIPFANRDEFEAAWPHLLQLKDKGAPLTLLRGQHLSVEK